jgi:hypothetical protein
VAIVGICKDMVMMMVIICRLTALEISRSRTNRNQHRNKRKPNIWQRTEKCEKRVRKDNCVRRDSETKKTRNYGVEMKLMCGKHSIQTR